MRVSMDVAFPARPLVMSHLGLSGMKGIIRRKSRAGTVSLPSIPLQDSLLNILAQSEASAEAPAFLSISQLARYARRKPTVTASW